MAIARWGTPGSRSANLAGTTLNSIATGSDSGLITYDNSIIKCINAMVLVKLGSINASATGSITLKITSSDGVDNEDIASAEMYPRSVTSGASAKVVNFKMVRFYPFLMRFNIVNNTGVTLAASGNEVYVTPIFEEIL